MSASTYNRQRDTLIKARTDVMAQQSETRRRRQAAALETLDCLQHVPLEQLLRLADMSLLRTFIPGTIILNERTPGDFLYLVLRGTISLTLHDRSGQKILICVLNHGDCFGEGSLFGDHFHGATVQAETICYLLQLPLARVRELLADAPELDAALRAIYRYRLVESTLGRVPLFGQLSPFERLRIATLLRPLHYRRGATIIEQGTPGDALFLIESGQAIVEQSGQMIAHLDEGDFFGEISLLTHEPHNAKVYAHTPVEVLSLPAAELLELLNQQPALDSQIREMVERRRAAGKALRNDPVRAQQLTAAVERGLLRGTHVLVYDPQRCAEGCHSCESACASRHGYPRIHIHGTRLNGVEVTDSCRQCRVGAECVEACPQNAIQWNNASALFITDSCNGCGECVPACPYNAIQLVNSHASDSSPLWSLWHQIKRLKSPTIPLETAPSRQRADKCDLCHGYDDLACVSACPGGALQLVPVEELLPL